MRTITDDDLETIEKNALFYGLTQDELAKIKLYLQKKILPARAVIVEEGELTTDIYLIARGEVSVLKWDEGHQARVKLLNIGTGQMFGEMSFVDSSPRSTAIETTKTTVLYKLSRQDLELNRGELGDIYNKILTNIARIAIERLRITNNRISSNLKHSLGGIQDRFDNALAAIYFAIAMSFVKLLTFMNLPFFNYNGKLINWGFWISLIVPAVVIIVIYHIKKEHLGLASKKLGKGFAEATAVVLFGIAIMYIITQYQNLNPLPLFRVSAHGIGLYFIFCIIYEFLSRGFFQSTLERVFINAAWLAPLASAIVFTILCLTSTLLQWPTIILIFVGNLVMGFLFLRNNDLYSVILAHFLLGLWLILN